MFTVAAVFVVPVQLFVAFFNRNALEDFEQLVDQNFSTTTNPSGSVGSPLASIIGAIGQSYAHVLVAAAIALMIVDWYGGDDPGPRELLRRLRPHVGTLFVAWLFIHLLELAGAFLLGIGTIVVMALYAVAAPAITIEGLGPFKGMARASRLDGGRFWFMVGFVILSGLVASAVGQVLALIPQFVGLALGPDYGWVAYGVGSIVVHDAGVDRGRRLDLPGLPGPPHPHGGHGPGLGRRPRPAGVSPDETRQLADEILSRREFQEPEPSLIERIQTWLGDALERLFATVGGGGAGSVVSIVVLAALIGLLVWFFVRLGRTVQADTRIAGITLEGVHRRSPAEWRAEAEEHEAAGRWKEALRSRYRALVGDLVAEGLLDDIAGRTTGELRRDLAERDPGRREAFDQATLLFELAWYADRSTGPDENARFQALAATITGVRA